MFNFFLAVASRSGCGAPISEYWEVLCSSFVIQRCVNKLRVSKWCVSKWCVGKWCVCACKLCVCVSKLCESKLCASKLCVCVEHLNRCKTSFGVLVSRGMERTYEAPSNEAPHVILGYHWGRSVTYLHFLISQSMARGQAINRSIELFDFVYVCRNLHLP